ncbi:MAG: hypothetical protein H0W50_09125 [Parachlamydiaceae bacterium]|nr:hypothetical protein [Parachlamydiaceae bacterium]
MDKVKTSAKQKNYSKGTPKMLKLKENAGLMEYSPTKELLNEDLIARAIWECLKNNDPEGVTEIIEAHLYAKNKTLL